MMSGHSVYDVTWCFFFRSLDSLLPRMQVIRHRKHAYVVGMVQGVWVLLFLSCHFHNFWVSQLQTSFAELPQSLKLNLRTTPDQFITIVKQGDGFELQKYTIFCQGLLGIGWPVLPWAPGHHLGPMIWCTPWGFLWVSQWPCRPLGVYIYTWWLFFGA